MQNLTNLNSEALTDLATKYSLKVLSLLLLLVATWILATWTQRFVRKALEKAKLEVALSIFLSKMARYAVLTLGGVSALDIFGIQTASFAAVLAAVGFAVGMALQGTLSNFASGVMILLFRPFKVGDVVQVSGTIGTVTEIDIFNTVLDTADNRRFIVPNNSVFGSKIENITFHKTRRVEVTVGTDYSADIDKTREILMGAAHRISAKLEAPAPAVVLTGLGASSIDWAVRIWVETSEYWPSLDALNREVKYALDKADIGIPFPQMDVHFSQPLENTPSS